MDIREKLIDLLIKVDCDTAGIICEKNEEFGIIADHLIANGVIIQEWIPISNRLPTKEDTYDGATILAVDKEYGIADPWSLESVLKYPQDFICWTQVPQPPKGE